MTVALVRFLRRFRRDDDGAALVEFALILPLLLLFFAVTIEGSRMMWSYQATIAGVRDATRYLGRTVQTNICSNGASLAAWQDRVTDIVHDTADGGSLFPASITIDRVTPTLTCFGGAYHLATTPVATVTADLTITWPFAGVLSYFGATLPVIRSQVADTGRVFGA